MKFLTALLRAFSSKGQSITVILQWCKPLACIITVTTVFFIQIFCMEFESISVCCSFNCTCQSNRKEKMHTGRMSSSEYITKAHHIIRCTLTADINRVNICKSLQRSWLLHIPGCNIWAWLLKRISNFNFSASKTVYFSHITSYMF